MVFMVDVLTSRDHPVSTRVTPEVDLLTLTNILLHTHDKMNVWTIRLVD